MAFQYWRVPDNSRGRYHAYFNTRRGGLQVGTQPSPLPSATLGPIIQSLSLDDLQKSTKHSSDARITDCKVLASYNWLDKRSPSIAIPGMPPRWCPPAQPSKLREDSGTYYRDLNAAKYPKSPMEPAVTAILLNNTISSNKIDIFGCGSTLGNLLRFVQGNSKPFRILVDVVGPTVHLIRREGSPLETISDVRGYGHTFPETYTSWDASVAGSSSHQRVIHYRLGGMNLAVRFEGDGYLPDKANKANVGGISSPPKTKANGEVDLSEEIAALLDIFGTAASEPNSPILISSAGISVPQAAIFDLKTRSNKKKLEEDTIIAGELPRLWLRQIPNLILAYHHSGTFKDIQVRDVQQEVAQWEVQNANQIQSLVALLRIIFDTAGMREDGKLEVSFDANEGNLMLREQMRDVPDIFSKDVRQRWEAWLRNEEQSSDDNKNPKQESGLDPNEFHQQDTVEYSSSDFSGEYDDHYYDRGMSGGWRSGNFDKEPMDFTACDKECGYCGKCDY